MARVVLIQNQWFDYMGPMMLSAALKAEGHSCEVILESRVGKMKDSLSKVRPDLVAFSVMTGMHRWALSTSKEIKKSLDVPIILGGPHATYFPEVLHNEGIDIACRGEGELAIVELANCIDDNSRFADIKNLWVKEDGRIIKNDVRKLIENLDILPFADRDLYYGRKLFRNAATKPFMTARGCPYSCSFCFNHKMKQLYEGKGSFVRSRSGENVIEEIIQVKEKYGLKTVYFIDDTFILNKKWILDFLKEYRQTVGLPFLCLVRADLLSEEMVYHLKSSGCESVFFGIEAGNERIRNLILDKRLSNDEIVQAAAWLKKYRIPFRAYNMVGAPGESLDDVWETIDLNVAIKTDYPWCSIYTPYPGTRLAEKAMDSGQLPKDFSPDNLCDSFFGKSLILRDDAEIIGNIQKFFQTAILFPGLRKVIKRLVKMKPNRFFDLWFGFVYLYVYLRSERQSVLRSIVMSVKNSRFLIGRKANQVER